MLDVRRLVGQALRDDDLMRVVDGDLRVVALQLSVVGLHDA